MYYITFIPIGKVGLYLKDPKMRRMILLEQVARVLKNELRFRFRTITKTGMSESLDQSYAVIVDLLNLVLERSPRSDEFWETVIYPTLRNKFAISHSLDADPLIIPSSSSLTNSSSSSSSQSTSPSSSSLVPTSLQDSVLTPPSSSYDECDMAGYDNERLHRALHRMATKYGQGHMLHMPTVPVNNQQFPTISSTSSTEEHGNTTGDPTSDHPIARFLPPTSGRDVRQQIGTAPLIARFQELTGVKLSANFTGGWRQEEGGDRLVYTDIESIEPMVKYMNIVNHAEGKNPLRWAHSDTPHIKRKHNHTTHMQGLRCC